MQRAFNRRAFMTRPRTRSTTKGTSSMALVQIGVTTGGRIDAATRRRRE
jgi:hypothetical protein